MTGTATILHGDARALPLPDNSVDLVVTSPPYWSLRAYTDGGEQLAGQIGSEATPTEYLDDLIACTREWLRVLKPGGSLWVNLGDKYSSGTGGERNKGMNARTGRASGKFVQDRNQIRQAPAPGMPPKCLLGLPWRYALRCIDELGLILRAEVIWSKPNGLPESVTDRVRRSHEQWFHLVQSPRYFSAVDLIREAHVYGAGRGGDPSGDYSFASGRNDGSTHTSGGFTTINPLGKLPGSVWTIATQPLKVPAHLGVDHFAAFPMEWPRRIILGWSPSGICTACGEGRHPVGDATRTPRPTSGPMRGGANRTKRDGHPGTNGDAGNMMTLRQITGEACACPDTTAATTPAVVLDPFGGTGTTATVAKAHGRHGITVDLSADYCRLAQWRTNDPAQLARALGAKTTRRAAK